MDTTRFGARRHHRSFHWRRAGKLFSFGGTVPLETNDVLVWYAGRIHQSQRPW